MMSEKPNPAPPGGLAMRGLSQRKLAVALGVSPKAIRSALAKKWITPLADGSFDEAAARAAYTSRVDPARTKVRREKPAPPSIANVDDARAALSLIRQVLFEEGVAAVGAVDFEMARTAETILKSRERHLRMQERSGKLCDAAVVRAEVFKKARYFRDSLQNWPARAAPILAAEYGIPQISFTVSLERHIRQFLTEMSDPGHLRLGRNDQSTDNVGKTE